MNSFTQWLNTDIEVWDMDIGPNYARLVPRWKLLFNFVEPRACGFAWKYKDKK